MIKKTLILIAAMMLLAGLMALSGCGGVNTYGVSEYELNSDGTFKITSGKETGEVEALMTKADDGTPGIVYFKATDVKAFEGQKIGARIATDVTNAIREVLPEIVGEAVKASLGIKVIDDVGTLLTQPKN